MKAIKVQISLSEWKKVDDFISETNKDEDTVAYAIDNTSMVIATSGEYSTVFMQVQLKMWFDNPIIETIK
jgi:stalled ribosome rescue protein Dom34